MSMLTGWIIAGVMGMIYAIIKGGKFPKWLIIGGPFYLVHALVSCVRCPVCDKRVNTKANICPFCRAKLPDRKGKANIKHCVVELSLFAVIVVLIFSAMRMGYFKDTFAKLPIISQYMEHL